MFAFVCVLCVSTCVCMCVLVFVCFVCCVSKKSMLFEVRSKKE